MIGIDWQWERQKRMGEIVSLNVDVIPLGLSYFQVRKMRTLYFFFLLWVVTWNNEGEPILWWEWLKQNVRWLRWWWSQ